MMNEFARKIRTDHLQRNAYLYVRQSTIRQIFENRESTKRQYALKERAIALGWPVESIKVIDCDLGQSGATSANREGFKELVSEVGMGRAGIVLGLEVSRLARNCSDWHRLLEICALTKTLILDEEGIYDPAHFNDRLLLGLKGTMSEAELHIIQARMRGGLLAKAKRGQLHTALPVGFVYNSSGKVILDPDKQIHQSIHLFFETFRRIGSASGAVKYFRRNGLKFPRKLTRGAKKGEVVWGWLVHSRAIQILHNPRYAGTYFYGRMESRKLPDGTTKYKLLPQDQWYTLIKNAHEGYICWEEYEENQRRLLENAQAHGIDRRKSPPREGPALLQGMVICGICGKRMTLHYYRRKERKVPYYKCQREGIEHGEPICQSIHGELVDEAMSRLLIETVSPLALDVALNVEDELKARLEEADRLRKQQVQRFQYEADLARRRYMQIDPENRLVADSLEAEWNEKLRALRQAEEEYERQRKRDHKLFSAEEREKILSLASDFPRLWNDPNTPSREKKRMVRLLVEDVTLIKTKDRSIAMHVRFKGGATRSLNLPAPVQTWDLNRTKKEIVSQIDELLGQYTDAEIADILNKEGKRSGMGLSFGPITVGTIRRKYGLKSRYERLREQGLLTLNEISGKIQLPETTIRLWAKKGMMKTHKYNDRNSCLYELDVSSLTEKLNASQRKGIRSKEFMEKVSNRNSEVQYEV